MSRFALAIVLLSAVSLADPRGMMTKQRLGPQQEVTKLVEPEPEPAANDECPDVVFIVDKSESMSYKLFENSVSIIRAMINAAAGGNFAIVTFSTDAQVVSPVRSAEDTLRFLDTDMTQISPSGSSDLAQGIQVTLEEVVPKMKDGKKMAVILTDGPSSTCVCPSEFTRSPCTDAKDYGKLMRDSNVYAAMVGFDYHHMTYTNAMFDQQCLVAKLSDGKPAYVKCENGEKQADVQKAANEASALMCSADRPFAFAVAVPTVWASMWSSLNAFVSRKGVEKRAADALGVEPPRLIMLAMISLAVVLMGVYLIVAWRKHRERKRIQEAIEEEERERAKQGKPSYGSVDLRLLL